MLESHAFRKGVVHVELDVTPEMRDLPDGDLVFRAYINGKEVEMLVPAERRLEALQLAKDLRQSVERGKAAIRLQGQEPKRNAFRQKLHVDGVWRARLLEQDQGIPIRRFQMIAARWRYRGADGNARIGGRMPG